MDSQAFHKSWGHPYFFIIFLFRPIKTSWFLLGKNSCGAIGESGTSNPFLGNLQLSLVFDKLHTNGSGLVMLRIIWYYWKWTVEKIFSIASKQHQKLCSNYKIAVTHKHNLIVGPHKHHMYNIQQLTVFTKILEFVWYSLFF